MKKEIKIVLLVLMVSLAYSAQAQENNYTIFYESFDQCKGKGGNDGNWETTAKDYETLSYVDGRPWYTSNGNGACKCAAIGKSGEKALIKSKDISFTGHVLLKFKAGAHKNSAGKSDSYLLNIKIGTYEQNITIKTGEWTDYCIEMNNAENKAIPIIFSAVKTGVIFFLDEVKVEKCGEMAISSVGWGTYFTDAEFIMPEGIEGYFVSPNNNESVCLYKKYQGGDIVPASTPLLIKSTEDNKETKTFYYSYSSTGASEATETNYLHGNLNSGTIAEVTGMDKYYKLLNGSNGLGWYLGAEDGGVFSLGANKAYLALSEEQANRANSLTLDEMYDETDGIKSVNANSMNDGYIYNLNGQRINIPVRGQMYIVNGKKFIQK